MAKPTVKQHLAAIRMLFDWLVTGQVVATNPAHSVHGPKHVVKRGKTTVLTAEQARELLDSIPLTRASRSARWHDGRKAMPRGPARSRADFRDDIRVRARRCRRFDAGRGLLSRRENVGGCACMKKAASAMRCRRIIIWKHISMPISTLPASAGRQNPALSLGRRPHGRTDRQGDASDGRLPHDTAPRRRARHAP